MFYFFMMLNAVAAASMIFTSRPGTGTLAGITAFLFIATFTAHN